MTTVFVYEHLTALGARGDVPLAPSLWAEGLAMRDAVVTDLQAIPNVTVSIIPHEDESHFRDLARRSDFAVVIAPETDGILEERCRWALESATTLLGPSPEAIHLTADKLALAEHFARTAVPHPVTTTPTDYRTLPFPQVWKPRFGAGSQSTYLVKHEQEHANLLCSPDMIVQEYIPGTAASVSLMMGPNGFIVLEPCGQRLTTDGRFHYLGGWLPLSRDEAHRTRALAEKVVTTVSGLFGYVGIDVLLAERPEHDCVIEINPRMTTSYIGLRQFSRVNLMLCLLQIVQGEICSDLIWGSDHVTFAVT